jgi:xanthine/CO dehydrogenase XdhC/CoxF family maturation factor
LTEDLAVFSAAERAAAEGRAVVLATIVRCRGSTPRGCGSKMLVDPERGLTGTVGGGCGEGEVIEAAREVLLTGAPRLLRIDLTEDLFSWSPAVCGGTFDVFVERVDPAPPVREPPDGGPPATPSTTTQKDVA